MKLFILFVSLAFSIQAHAAHRVGDWIRMKATETINGNTETFEFSEEITEINGKEIEARLIVTDSSGKIVTDQIVNLGELRVPETTAAEMDTFCTTNLGLRSKTTVNSKPVEICSFSVEENQYIFGNVPVLGLTYVRSVADGNTATFTLLDFGYGGMGREPRVRTNNARRPHKVGEWSRFKMTTIENNRKIVRDVLHEVIAVSATSFTVRMTTKDIDGATQIEETSYGAMAGPAENLKALDRECRKYQGLRSKRAIGGKQTEVCQVQFHPQGIQVFGMVPILGIVTRYFEDEKQISALELVDYKF